MAKAKAKAAAGGIGVYERVSDGGRQDLAAQHGELKTWAGSKKGVKWYMDRFTGKTMDRPAYKRLMRDVRVGNVKTVVCWRLDRLGRTASGLTALFDELRELKVNFISLREGLNLMTPAGHMLAVVLSGVAQFETEVRGERIRAGIEAKRKRGEPWNAGRKKGQWLKISPLIREQILQMKADGLRVSDIAETFGLSRWGVYLVLKGEQSTTANVNRGATCESAT